MCSRTKTCLTFWNVLITVVVGCGYRSLDTPGSKLIRVTMRGSLLDSDSAVLQLENISSQIIPEIVIMGENLDNRQSFSKGVEPPKPGEVVEFGIVELDWRFLPNERITLLIRKPGVTGVPPKNATREELRKYICVDVYETYKAESGIIGVKHIRGH